MAIDLDTLSSGLAAMPWAQPERPFGAQTLVFKVGGRMFAMVARTDAGGRATFKGDPVLAEVLPEAYPGATPGYHTNKRHWSTVSLDGDAPDEVVWNMAQASDEIVLKALPRTVRAGLA